MSWLSFAGVFALFFLTHSIPLRPQIKSAITQRIGKRSFGLVYAILSITMLWLLIWSAGKAPYLQLWPQMPWQRHVAHLGMLIVCLMLAFTIVRPNPFSFGGARNAEFDPMRAGIARHLRHPVLAALALWAGLHLLPNGDLAHVLLFGILGGFAIAGRSLINQRKHAAMGIGHWQALDTAVRQSPLIQPPLSWSDAVLRGICGIAAFGLLLLLHPHVIGVAAY